MVRVTNFCKIRTNIYNIDNSFFGGNVLVVQVHIKIKDRYIQNFIEESIENASNSIKEPGIARFDLIQQKDDPSQFILNEVYRSADATVAHKETAHYKKWKAAVSEMMAEPRNSIKYSNLFPADSGNW